jgi:prepilin-type N-terminal cleavage/methylation domain-containing protein
MKKIKKIIQKSRAGFTLIELLVVIGIIAVLATIGTISFGNANKKARDAKRQSDMKTLTSGLTLYNTNKGCYPGNDTVCGDVDVSNNTWAKLLTLMGVSGTNPPSTVEQYCYFISTTASAQPAEFVLVVTDFEGDIPSNAVVVADADADGVLDNYALSNNSKDATATGCGGENRATVPAVKCKAAATTAAVDQDYCIKSTSIGL